MKVVFFSNFMNHHQFSFCSEMKRLPDMEFTFVATEEIPEERLNLGYADMNRKYDFVLTAYDSEENKQSALQLAKDCDVAIFGACPETYLQHRMQDNKLSFRFCERPLKGGRWSVLRPKVLYGMLKTHTRYLHKRLYLLSASAYAAMDFRLAGAYIGKAYRWGYFPAVKKYADIDEVIAKKEPGSILWAGRLLGWKHPEAPILVAKRLKEHEYAFRLKMIGCGEMEAELEELVAAEHLHDCVSFLGAMTPQEVRSHMEQSEIFLFTSDRNEGWGAVLNEAMNSGCAVIASREIGSVPFLIGGGNGFTYSVGDIDSLYSIVKECFDHSEIASKAGKGAYATVVSLWSPENAARSFVRLANALLNGEKRYYEEDGPCSRARLL